MMGYTINFKKLQWGFVLEIVFMIALWISVPKMGAASGFVDNTDAINQAAQSVLMLEVYDANNKCYATGSGFVAIDSNKLITNYHVIESASYLIANTDDGRKYTISNILCANKRMDVAILLFDENSSLAPLPLYCGDQTVRGESVLAIGSPIGITNTVSKGNVSALYMDGEIPFIQFTAPTSHGSSGGALFNNEGIVIGITTGGYSEGENMNLAIPAFVAQAMYNSWNGALYSLADAPFDSLVDFETITDNENTIKGIEMLSDTAQWNCPNCGNLNTSKFCLQCGRARPEWVCRCGQRSISPYCGRCGSSVENLVAELNTLCDLFDDAEYRAAASGFLKLGAFDSGTYVTAIGTEANANTLAALSYYTLAENSLAEGDYQGAISQFQSAGTEFMDSSQRIYEAYYKLAEELLGKGDYKSASDAFIQAGTYADASQRILEPYYIQAGKLMQQGKLDEALKAYQMCEEYADSSDKVKEVYYRIGLSQLVEGEYDLAIASFTLADGFVGASARISEATWRKASDLANRKEYQAALDILSTIPDYGLTAGKQAEIFYQIGLDALQKADYEQAVQALTDAGVYADAKDKLRLLYTKMINEQIDCYSYYDAWQLCTEAASKGISIEDRIILKPDDEGIDAAILLQTAKELGFINRLHNNETIYCHNYADSIKGLESFLNLYPDGVIHLSEMAVITTVIYPGYKGETVAPILERLKDLGYITAKLPDVHQEYNKSFTGAVKKAERALTLTPDGVLTTDEQQIILQQEAEPPEKVNKVIAKIENNSIGVTWTAAKGAIWYEIYRNGELITSVSGTSYKDRDAAVGVKYNYCVFACNYSKKSPGRYSNTLSIPVSYKTISASEFSKHYDNYQKKFLRLNSLHVVKSDFESEGLYVIAKNGSTYVCILITDYKYWDTSWLYKNSLTFSVSGIAHSETYHSQFGQLPVLESDEIQLFSK